VKQHLIKWEGLEDCQATWEDNRTMQQAFPEFNLEDKVSFKGEGNVTNVTTTEAVTENSGKVDKGDVEGNERKRCSARTKNKKTPSWQILSKPCINI